MTQTSVTERLLSWGQSLGLGLAFAAIGGGAALAHGDHATAGLLHTLSHQATEVHLLALLSAGIPIIALRVLSQQKRDGKEE